MGKNIKKSNGWDALSERVEPGLIAALVKVSGLDTRIVVRYLKGSPTKPHDRTELEKVLREHNLQHHLRR